MEASALEKSMEMAMRKGVEDVERKKVDRFEFLPDEILLDILKRVPEAVLCYRAKYVCKRWLDMISSRILADHPSLIVQNRSNLRLCYVGIREEGEGLEVKEQELNIPVTGLILSWGSEFLLILDYTRKSKSLYVYNVISKEGSYLPKCDVSCGEHATSKCGVALSFDGFKGIYKVVHLFMGPPIQCHIIVLRRGGIVSSEWKKIQVSCTIGGSLSIQSLTPPATAVGRYIHWWVDGSKYLISMDVVKEEVIQMWLPGVGRFYAIFEMGGSLGMFDGVSRDTVDIWILKDFEMMKWEKLQSVTLRDWYPHRYPVCGVMMRYVILKSLPDRGLLCYDLKKGVVEKLHNL